MNSGLNKGYDIDELEDNNFKNGLKKDTPPSSTQFIFKGNGVSNVKKGKIVKKNSIKKNSKLPISPKMKAMIKTNYFPTYMKK